ncbi:hypothetical protein HY612_03510 [Candidatus Roizmanbacteria bacterium]|nr:hypothetical protein [Candidatus Roizmanbacteria bacterium]
MTNAIGPKNKKSKLFDNQNTVESIKGFDQIFTNKSGDYQNYSEELGWPREIKKPIPKQRKEFSLFNYQQYYELEIVKKEIKELTEQIRKEIEFIKKADASLLQEVKDVQRLSLESLPEKPGIYHIRFFEIILSILRALRAKIGESRTWLQAMISKKKKRGSLFTARSKKRGTLYSLSQELQSARSIQ